MAKKMRQARKKQRKGSLFSLKKKDLFNSASSPVYFWMMVCAVVLLGISSAMSYVSKKLTQKQIAKSEIAKQRRIDQHKRKEVIPLNPDQYKEEKHYSFYDQLERRSFNVLDKEAIGGEMPSEVTLQNNTPDLIGNIIDDSKNIPKIASSTNQPLVLIGQSEKTNTPPKEKMAEIKTTPTIKNTQNTQQKGAYKRLQTGSFLSQNESLTHKKRLEAQGFNVQITSAQNAQNKTIYRVQIGPLAPNELSDAKKRLQAMNISFFETK